MKLPVLLIVDHCAMQGHGNYGKKVFFQALRENGIEAESARYFSFSEEKTNILIGRTDDRMVQLLLEQNGGMTERKPEGVIYRWCDTADGKVLVVSGTDETGLMYALLELAERVNAHGVAGIEKTENLAEFPDNLIRSVSRFVMSSRDDAWFYSEDFWQYYMRRLVRYRFNRFVLILGFDTPYMSPPYPFFVEVPGYPDVKAIGMTDLKRRQNLEMLRRIGQICHEYGLQYNLATWQQTLWNDNQKAMVEGLEKDEDALSDYCAAGLKCLLEACPEVDVLQLRVNHEAGVGTQETNEAFWKRMITAVAETDHKVKLDLRAKGLTDGMIRFALEQGLELAVPTKYWCEHIALPYHISKMRTEELERLSNFNHSRRYSYADMLKKPHSYDLIYRLWNYGSNTIFLWGDPDYARRFSASLEYGGSIGYEITAPLSLKGGQATYEGPDWPLFKDESLIHYRWEDERYWAYYLFFGRLCYNAKTASEVWQREFKAHFGAAAGAMEEAYRTAGKILPMITTFHMPIHPSLSYWIEISTGAALFGEHNYNSYFGKITYQDSEPSDSGLFYGISEYARDVLAHRVTGRYSPLQVAQWLDTMAQDVTGSLAIAEELDGGLTGQKEYRATKADMLMQAYLAQYHAEKTRAAYALSLYELTRDARQLKNAHYYAALAEKRWQALCQQGSVYQDDINVGVGGVSRRGHWCDRLPELQKDVAKLEQMLREAGTDTLDEEPEAPFGTQAPQGALVSYQSDVPETCIAGQDLNVHVQLGEFVKLCGGLQMHYRHMNQLEGHFEVIQMTKTDKGYTAAINAEYITPEWDLMVYFTGTDPNNNVLVLPGIYHSDYPAPYHVIKTQA